MKKNILVSVDRGETRVAVLEAKGSPSQAKRRKKASPSDEWKVAELYVERLRRAGVTTAYDCLERSALRLRRGARCSN